jgi:hypothetical protein
LLLLFKVPRLALANYNFLAPVPPELTDLTVILEAMIARCRDKCWIIQLKEEDDFSTPITQRGVRGHVIVYPQRPSDIAKILPPSIEEVVTLICVIFVGSNRRTEEWLQKKEKPLTMRKEKVMATLVGLNCIIHSTKTLKLIGMYFKGSPMKRFFNFMCNISCLRLALMQPPHLTSLRSEISIQNIYGMARMPMLNLPLPSKAI